MNKAAVNTTSLVVSGSLPAKRKGNWKSIIIIVVLFVVGLLFIYPFIWMLSTSLKSNVEVYTRPLALIPKVFEFSNYPRAFTLLPFGRFYLNTIIMTLGRVCGQIVLASLAAYSFARLKFPGRDFMFVMVLGVMMVPSSVSFVPRFLMMLKMGWLDTYWGLIIPGWADAFGVFLLRQFFMGLPQDLIDASELDGCNPIQTFFRVALPLSTAPLAAYGFLVVLWTWNDFLWPLVVVSRTNMLTISLGIQLYQSHYSADIPAMMAAATISILPMTILFLFAQKYIIQGITMTGLKL